MVEAKRYLGKSKVALHSTMMTLLATLRLKSQVRSGLPLQSLRALMLTAKSLVSQTKIPVAMISSISLVRLVLLTSSDINQINYKGPFTGPFFMI